MSRRLQGFVPVLSLSCLAALSSPAYSQVSGPVSSDTVRVDDDGRVTGAKAIQKIRFAAAFAGGGSKTGGIQEAINDCGDRLVTTGCIVVLPQGEVTVTSTIEVGGSAGKDGIVLIGHGSGEKNNLGANLGGSSIRWGGKDGGTVLRIGSTSFSRFADFAIDGNRRSDGSGGAGIAIDVSTGASTCSPSSPPPPSQEDTFQNLYITNLANGTEGPPETRSIGIRIAPACGNYQVSEITLRQIVVTGTVNIGFLQDGQQTAMTRFENNDVAASSIGFKLVDGTALLIGNSITTNDGALAGVWIGELAGPITLNSNNHEIRATYGIYTDVDTSAQGWNWNPINVIGDTLQQFRPSGGFILKHQQLGPFNLIGCDVFTTNGANRATIAFANPIATADGNTMRITSVGSFYGSSIDWSFSGGYSFVGIDGATSAAQLNARQPLTLDGVGLVRRGGSDNWASADGTTKYRWYLNKDDDQLRLLDGGPTENVLGYFSGADWTTNGQFKSNVATPFRLEGSTLDSITTSIAVQEPTSNQTVTIPNATGTILLDTDALAVTTTGIRALTHKTLTDPTNVFPAFGVVNFFGAGPGNGATWYYGPNSGAVDTAGSEASISGFVPSSRARTLRCRASVTPEVSRTFTINLRKNEADVAGTCTLNASTNPCSVGIGSAFSEGDRVALRVVASDPAPATANIACMVDFGN